MTAEERRNDDPGDEGEVRREVPRARDDVTVAATSITAAVIAAVWLASGTVLAVIAAVAPAGVFEEDWGFGLMVCVVLAIAAWTTRTIIREM